MTWERPSYRSHPRLSSAVIVSGNRSHSIRRPRLSSLVIIMAALVLLVLATSICNSTASDAASKSLGESMPGFLIPIIVGPDLGAQTMVPQQRPNLRALATTEATTFQVSYTGFTGEAQAAFQAAVDIWSTQISSPVPIIIDARFAVLSSNILGSAGANSFQRDFINTPQAGTWYPAALANKLAGTDLTPGTSDITAQFNSDFNNFYFGSGSTPLGQINFTSVVLHELGHGLGFSGSTSYSSGLGTWGGGTGFPFIYDCFVYNGSGQQLISTFPNNSASLGSQYTDGSLFFTAVLRVIDPRGNSRSGGTSLPHRGR